MRMKDKITDSSLGRIAIEEVGIVNENGGRVLELAEELNEEREAPAWGNERLGKRNRGCARGDKGHIGKGKNGGMILEKK